MLTVHRAMIIAGAGLLVGYFVGAWLLRRWWLARRREREGRGFEVMRRG